MSKINNTHREIPKLEISLDDKVSPQAPSIPLNGHVYCINFLKDSQQLHFQLALIHQQLEELPCAQKINQLSLLLDQASSSLKSLKRDAQSLSPQSDYFSDIENRIIYTYGLIQNAHIQLQFAEIQEVATQLKAAIALNQPRDTLKISLKQLIDNLLQNYRPSIEERRVLSELKNIIETEKNLAFTELTYPQADTGEQCEDLFDIAVLLYDRNFRSAKARYHQLSEDTKEIFKSHIKHLLAIPFVDLTETLQALLATMNDLAGNGESYPTPNEMDEIFLGLRQVNFDKGECLFHDIKTTTYNHPLSG